MRWKSNFRLINSCKLIAANILKCYQESSQFLSEMEYQQFANVARQWVTKCVENS